MLGRNSSVKPGKTDNDEADISTREEELETDKAALMKIQTEDGASLASNGKCILGPEVMALIQSSPESQHKAEIQAMAVSFSALLAKMESEAKSAGSSSTQGQAIARYAKGTGELSYVRAVDAEGDAPMEMVELPDLDDWDEDDEPPVPIPENMGDKEVHAEYVLKASALENRRQEREKKRKAQTQGLKETFGKLSTAAPKHMVKSCKK